MSDSESRQVYTIPGNYTNSGKVYGLFDMRCIVEAGIIGVAIIYPVLKSRLGLEIKIFTIIAIAIIIIFFVGSGIRGDSITQYIGIVYQQIKSRRRLSVVIDQKGGAKLNEHKTTVKKKTSSKQKPKKTNAKTKAKQKGN